MRVPSTTTHVMSKILLYLYPDPIFETTTISLDLSDSKYVWSAKDTPLFGTTNLNALRFFFPAIINEN